MDPDRPFRSVLITLLVLLFFGCKANTDGAEEGCPAGLEGCACIVGECVGGLTCASNVCVDLGAMSTTGMPTTSTSSTTSTSTKGDPTTAGDTDSSGTTGEPPPMKPDLPSTCPPGEYGCECDCSSGLFCECAEPFVCGSDNLCGYEQCLAQYEPCEGSSQDCCDDMDCLGLPEQMDYACVSPCQTDADCPVTCCVETTLDALFCAPSTYYC